MKYIIWENIMSNYKVTKTEIYYTILVLWLIYIISTLIGVLLLIHPIKVDVKATNTTATQSIIQVEKSALINTSSTPYMR